MPNLLVAPISSTAPSKNLHDDYAQGYYTDGAYIAVPNEAAQFAARSGQTDEDLDPQEAYYASLCSRFIALNAALQSSPPDNIRDSLSRGSEPSLNGLHLTSWRWHILHTGPSTVLLSQLRQVGVVYGLQVLEKLLTRRNLLRNNNIGTWAWGLLARCRGVGQMSSEEVGVLRDLGKKANWIVRRIRAGLEEVEEPMGNLIKEKVDDDDDDDSERGKGTGSEEYDDEMEVGFPNELVELKTNSITLPQLQTPSATLRLDIDDSNRRDCALEPSSSLPKDLSDPLTEARQRLLRSLELDSQLESSSIAQKHTISPPRGSANDNGSSPRSLPNQDLMEDQATEADDEATLDRKGNEEERTSALHATLDMIVTVVGEFYGQKDLLDGRLLWDEIP